MGTQTGSVTLKPTGYTGLTNFTTSTSYPIDRGYNDTSNSSFARFTISSNNATGYIYYKFPEPDIPNGATITSVSAQARAYVNNTSRVINTVCQLYSGATAKGTNKTFDSTSTSNIVTLDPGSSWSTNDFSDLRIRIGGTGSGGSSKYVYFAGATVTINYSVTTYTITSSTSDGTINPSGSTEVVSGGTYVLSISGITPRVTDNNVDVTSQLVQETDRTVDTVPSGNTNSGFTLSNINNAYTDADSDTYAQLTLAGSATGTIYLTWGSLNIPTGATVKNVSCQVTLQFSRNNSTSGFTSSCSMYANTTAKGSATNWVTSATDVAKTTYTLNTGSWTASEVNSARFYLTATNSARSTQRYIYIYGVSFSATYESDGITYVYTLNNVSTDHTIVVSSGGSSPVLYVKLNGSWVSVSKAYKKVSGSWVEQGDLTTVFDSTEHYKKG